MFDKSVFTAEDDDTQLYKAKPDTKKYKSVRIEKHFNF